MPNGLFVDFCVFTCPNNPMSSFGLIEESMELSNIHLAINDEFVDG